MSKSLRFALAGFIANELNNLPGFDDDETGQSYHVRAVDDGSELYVTFTDQEDAATTTLRVTVSAS